MKTEKTRHGHGWAWECDFGLCNWVESSREILLFNGKPSPEAKPVYVRIIKEKDFRAIISSVMTVTTMKARQQNSKPKKGESP